MGLTTGEQQLLTEIVSRRAPHADEELARALRGERLSVAEANVLRDAVGMELAATGVDSTTGAVDERGRMLDRLIDRIASMSDLHDARPSSADE